MRRYILDPRVIRNAMLLDQRRENAIFKSPRPRVCRILSRVRVRAFVRAVHGER